MKAKWLPISAAVALALGSVSASAVDFHGYARSGLNYASDGGNAYCSGTGTSGYLVGRLGNECNTYVELGLSQEVFNKANNKFTVNTLTVWRTYEDNIDYQGNSWQAIGGSGGGWGGQQASLREIWSGYEMPSGMQIWAGKRYYQRKDIHIMDYYYLNNGGTGFGVENIAVGNLGSVSVALIKNQADGSTIEFYDRGKPVVIGQSKDVNSWKLDARWNGIPLWSDASLDVAMIYGWQNVDDANKQKGIKANNAFLGHIELTQGNFFGGFNKVVFQYGHDGFMDLGSLNGGNHSGDNIVPSAKGSGFRLIDWGVIEQPKWNLGYAVMASHLNVYDENEDEGGKGWSHNTGNDYAFVIRPAYKWSDFTSTVLEFGYTNLTNHYRENSYNEVNGKKPMDKDRVKMTKLTLAQQWTPGSHFWARPSIRVFGSWQSGDLMNYKRAHVGMSKNSDGTWTGKNHQFVFGAQVEAWW